MLPTENMEEIMVLDEEVVCRCGKPVEHAVCPYDEDVNNDRHQCVIVATIAEGIVQKIFNQGGY